MLTHFSINVYCGKLRHFCDDPVCPDSIWKLSRETHPGVCFAVRQKCEQQRKPFDNSREPRQGKHKSSPTAPRPTNQRTEAITRGPVTQARRPPGRLLARGSPRGPPRGSPRGPKDGPQEDPKMVPKRVPNGPQEDPPSKEHVNNTQNKPIHTKQTQHI